MENQERQSLIEKYFILKFNRKPKIWTRAPGRVDLMGSHTDYNEGFVITMTIDKEVWLAVAPRTDHKIQIFSMNMNNGSKIDLTNISHDPINYWSNYVRGVAWSAVESNLPISGFDGVIHSNVPIGSGVSSSAALESCISIYFNEFGEWNLNKLDQAKLCQKAENDFVGLNCGILDQYTSILGVKESAIFLDCRNLTHKVIPIHEDITIVICDTKKKRELRGSEYSERRKQCELGASFFSKLFPEVKTLRDVSLEQFNEHMQSLDFIIRNRCQFIIEENQRVLELRTALFEGNTEKIKFITEESYKGARDLYEIGSYEYEIMMKSMLNAPGIIGARQAGAGFGGCMVAFVQENKVVQFIEFIKETYKQKTKIDPNVYPVKAVEGAGIIDF